MLQVTGTSWKIYNSIWRRDSVCTAGTEEIIECMKWRLRTDNYLYIGELQRGVTGFCRYHYCVREMLTLRTGSVLVRGSSKILHVIFVACVKWATEWN
jgi:hypothetical protein